MAAVLAVIGGSGLYDVEALEAPEEVRVTTPFGEPSDAIARGRFRGTDTIGLFLPRHGRGHRFSPTDINYRANICALKMLGATHVLSVSAVGSSLVTTSVMPAVAEKVRTTESTPAPRSMMTRS